MIHHSPARLVFIRTCILLLRYAPLIETALLLGLLFGSSSRPYTTAALAILLTIEIVFAVFAYLPHKSRISHQATHPPPLTRKEREALFERCVANIPDWDRYLHLWFLYADPSEIRRDNLRDFLLWAFFDSDTTVTSHEDEITHYIHRVETRLGRALLPGRGAAVPLRLTLDAVPICYRSIIWYLIIALIDLATHLTLRRHGFNHHTTYPAPQKIFPPRAALLRPTQHVSPSPALTYWHRPHRSKTHHPILFIHGIGIGLWPYTSFLADLDPQIGIIALELLPISARLTHPPLSQAEFLSHLATILASHGPEWERFVLVSHSYGSVLTTHILRSAELSPRVHALVLIDPVSVLLHLPDVAYNFTRRKPRTANEWQLWYFASMDVGVAEGLGRYFFWRENIIWREELVGQNRKVAASLAGRDLIVDTRAVARYLASEGDFTGEEEDVFDVAVDGNYLGTSGVEILWFPRLDHAQAFEERRDWRRVGEVVRKYCLVEDVLN
ncbi:hypothetical protein OQA88_8062 [Cercophora sp. LCS_1]